jgi:hypothetical protein
MVDFRGSGEGVGDFEVGDIESLENGVDGLAPGQQDGIDFGQRLARRAAEEAMEDDGMQAINLGEPGLLDKDGLGLAGARVEHEAKVSLGANPVAQASCQDLGVGQVASEAAAALRELAVGGAFEVQQQTADTAEDDNFGQAVKLAGESDSAHQGPGVALKAVSAQLRGPALDVGQGSDGKVGGRA